MTGRILVGVGRNIEITSDERFLASLRDVPERMAARLSFMTAEHHLVRNFVVADIPRHGRPLSTRYVAAATGLALERVSAIVDELERHLFFLVRNIARHVSWAFPVTTARTAHRLTFSTGEQIFGA